MLPSHNKRAMVRRMHSEGFRITRICRETDLDRKTVLRILVDSGTVPLRMVEIADKRDR